MHPIKTFCKQHKMKIKELAIQVDKKPRYLYQVITGYRKASLEFATKVEEATKGAVSRMDVLYPD
jgi:DNA-binding transcriptional regulator YdaS (Cro superfamily)